MVVQHTRSHPLRFTRKRVASRKVVETAAIVFDCIPAAPAPAISQRDLCALSGLTVGQVKRALEHIRDNHPDLPLVHTVAGYSFTTEPDKVAANRHEGAKSAHTRIRRLWDGLILPYISQPGFNKRDAKQVTKQFERVLEDVAELIG